MGSDVIRVGALAVPMTIGAGGTPRVRTANLGAGRHIVHGSRTNGYGASFASSDCKSSISGPMVSAEKLKSIPAAA